MKLSKPPIIFNLHSFALALVVERPDGEHFAEARQMHASYWIVQAPELCAAQLLTVMTELFSAAAVMLVIMAGTARTFSKRASKNMT